MLELTVDDDAVVARLLKRAESEGRADDTEEVIRERMAIYHRETKPLSDTYRERGLLVDGRRPRRGRRGHPSASSPPSPEPALSVDSRNTPSGRFRAGGMFC